MSELPLAGKWSSRDTSQKLMAFFTRLSNGQSGYETSYEATMVRCDVEQAQIYSGNSFQCFNIALVCYPSCCIIITDPDSHLVPNREAGNLRSRRIRECMWL
jgi:hypothetical protein